MRTSIICYRRVLLCGLWLAIVSVVAFAHGGEDHGDAKAPAISTSASMSTRTMRAGDYEVTLKHPVIEPDQETTARVFVTRFNSNEPVEKASIILLFSSGGAPVEASAAAASTAGMYEAKLPPLREGEYQLAVRVAVNGTTETIKYGALRVAPSFSDEAETSSSWAQSALIMLGALTGLGIVGIIIYRARQSARHQQAEKVTVTA